MMVLEWGSNRILVRTTNFQDLSPSWAITLASVDSPNYYKADYAAQIAYGYEGTDTTGTLHRIHGFNSNSPIQTQIAFESAPGVIWSFGGWRLNNLAVATDDPSEIAIGVRNYLTARARFHVSDDEGVTWTASDEFPSETSYYGNQSSGVWCVCPKPGATGVWYLIAKCGWDGPMYDYEFTGADLGSASRTQIEINSGDLHLYRKVLASGADSLGNLWFRAYRNSPFVEDSMFLGHITNPSLAGPFQTQPMIPFSVSSPGVIVADQVKVYRSGWVDLGTTGLIATPSFLAPCALDSSQRWAVGGSGVIVDPILDPAIIKYCGTGGLTDGDWSDKTGNLHTLLDALAWVEVDVHTIIPVLGG